MLRYAWVSAESRAVAGFASVAQAPIHSGAGRYLSGHLGGAWRLSSSIINQTARTWAELQTTGRFAGVQLGCDCQFQFQACLRYAGSFSWARITEERASGRPWHIRQSIRFSDNKIDRLQRWPGVWLCVREGTDLKQATCAD